MIIINAVVKRNVSVCCSLNPFIEEHYTLVKRCEEEEKSIPKCCSIISMHVKQSVGYKYTGVQITLWINQSFSKHLIGNNFLVKCCNVSECFVVPSKLITHSR